MDQIAFMGGSFNPPHRAHLALAAQACESLDLTQVRFVPAFQAPLKDAPSTDLEHRVNMLKLAIQDEARFAFEPYEVERQSISYTIDTLRHFHKKEHANLFWIIGADQLAQLHRWKDIEEIFELANFAVAMRPPYDNSVFDTLTAHFSDTIVERLKRYQIQMPLMDISSTQIRQRVAQGEAIDELVPQVVAQYIETHGLYHDQG